MEWLQKDISIENYQTLLSENNFSELTAKLLVSRGITNSKLAKSFLYPDFNNDFHNPLLLKDVDVFLKRVNKAKTNNQKVLVHGDYDTDGVFTIYTAMKILKDVLKLDVTFYAPNRFKDGYGVNARNVDYFKEFDLVITGDTGIKAFDAIGKLTDLGVDVIVTDHHEPMILEDTEENREMIPANTMVIEQDDEFMVLPKCLAVINPKRFDCPYPSKDLCGAGVIFKLMQALLDYLHYDKKELYFLLDGVGAASVADLVPLMNPEKNTFEVRNMVKVGLAIMNNYPKMWTQSIMIQKLEERLMKNPKAKNEIKQITSIDLGFVFGPIINAVGRLYDPTQAVDYVLQEVPKKSQLEAAALLEINKERQELTAAIAVGVMDNLKKLPEEHRDYVIIATSDDLHQGITGLIASNVLEEYYRTTIAFAKIEIEGVEYYKGSARSIPGVNIYECLIEVQKEFGKYEYGGHEQAAGMTIEASRLEEFRVILRKVIKSEIEKLGEDSVFEPKKYYDMEIKIAEATHKQVDELKLLEPFGMGNEEPIFCAKDLILEKLSPIGSEAQYAKMIFSQDGVGIAGVMFNKAKKAIENYRNLVATNPYQRIKCDVLFTFSINDYDNKVQLQIKEIKFK